MGCGLGSAWVPEGTIIERAGPACRKPAVGKAVGKTYLKVTLSLLKVCHWRLEIPGSCEAIAACRTPPQS